MTDPRHWTNHQDTLRALVTTPDFGLISDFDGVLSPFMMLPEQAAITPANAQALDALAETGAVVALVSGRGVRDLNQRFARPWASYYGNHGMELWRDNAVVVADQVQPWMPPLEVMLTALGDTGLRGVIVENKGASASVHYRLADDPAAAREFLYRRLLPLSEEYGFELSEGQFIWEIKPPVTLSKGTAAETLVSEFQLGHVLFMGDDITDIYAMRRLRELVASADGRLQAISIGVIHPTSPVSVLEACDLTANGVSDVEALLAWVHEQRTVQLSSHD